MKGSRQKQPPKGWVYVVCTLAACAVVALVAPLLFPRERDEGVKEALNQLYQQGLRPSSAIGRASRERVVASMKDAGLLLEQKPNETATTQVYAILNDWAGQSDVLSLKLEEGYVKELELRLRRYPGVVMDEAAREDRDTKRAIFCAALSAYDADAQVDEKALQDFLALLNRALDEATSTSGATAGAVEVLFRPVTVLAVKESSILMTIREA